MRSLLSALFALLVLPLFSPMFAQSELAGGLTPYDLRCDGMVSPLGIDAAPPALSWKLSGDGFARRQTAYRIRVSRAEETLRAGEGDLWDSGKVMSGSQTHIPYEGTALRADQKAHWSVMVWDETDSPSEWASPAFWTMGALSVEDWASARWIAHPDWLAVNRAQLGFRSLSADSTATPKWLQIDLGASHRIDTIKLHALRHTVAERLGFPTVFKLRIAPTDDMSGASTLADYTETPYRNSWATRHTIEAGGVAGRFIRIDVPELRDLNGAICLAFSQIEVISNGENVALGAVVTASDSLEDELWSAAAVVDGKGVPGSNPFGVKTALLRRAFEAEKEVKRATLRVVGLGQYAAYLNGRKIGVDKLSPGWTDTDATILYDTRDVTDLIESGSNVLGLSLASGMYSVYDPGSRYTKFEGRFRPLMALAVLRIEYGDGSVATIGSDESWTTTVGPVTYCHVYGGEDYDARLEPRGWQRPGFDDSDWLPAANAPRPQGQLRGASFAAPPIRGVERLAVRSVSELSPNRTIYDLGQNAALMPRLAVSGPAGSRIRIVPGELLKEDGSIYRGSAAHGAKDAYWEYTLAGDSSEEIWEPEFFYHGARYLQVDRYSNEEDGALPTVLSIEGIVTHSVAEPVGSFACSNELFNRVRTLIRWAQRSNMVSVLTDCPHRERLGWLEQYHLNGPSLRYEFALDRLFMKTFGDMADAQTTEGLVPDIAPEFITFEGGFRDSPEWGSALILAAWQQYVWTGDTTVLQRFYDEMTRYVDYLGSKADGHILSHGLGDWYDLGPGRPGFAQLTPIAVTATAIYFEDVTALKRIAHLIGRTDDAERFERLGAAIKEAFVQRLYDAPSGTYGTESQTGNAMAFVLGLYPDGRANDLLNAIVADIQQRGNAFTAGDVGHRYLLLALAKGGRSDVIVAMHNQTDRPGYGWQLERGATSLTEAWDAGRHSSQNHFMLGHIMEWFYGSLAGINPDPEQPGFRNVIIRPQPVAGIDWAEASFESVRGPISTRWERTQKGVFQLDVTLAPNMTASVQLPFGGPDHVQLNGKPLNDTPFARQMTTEEGRLSVPVPSGAWRFTIAP